MATTNDVLNAIKDHLKTTFTGLKTVDVIAGRFSLVELKRISTKAPAMLVAELGTASIESQGNGQANPMKSFAIFIVTRDEKNLKKEVAARNLADALEIMLVAEMPVWKINNDPIPGVKVPEQVKTDNLYSTEIDKTGVCLYGVTWRQKITIGDNIFTNEGTVPTELYVGYDPATGTDNQGSYDAVPTT